MRLVSVSNPRKWSKAVDHFLDTLAAHRDGKGAWRRFPFYYTTLALTELKHPKAREELDYILPACQKKRARLKPKDEISERRIVILDRILDSR